MREAIQPGFCRMYNTARLSQGSLGSHVPQLLLVAAPTGGCGGFDRIAVRFRVLLCKGTVGG